MTNREVETKRVLSSRNATTPHL